MHAKQKLAAYKLVSGNISTVQTSWIQEVSGVLCAHMTLCRTHICSFAACAALQYTDALFTEALSNASWWGDHADSSRGFLDPQGGTQYFSLFSYPVLCQS